MFWAQRCYNVAREGRARQSWTSRCLKAVVSGTDICGYYGRRVGTESAARQAVRIYLAHRWCGSSSAGGDFSSPLVAPPSVTNKTPIVGLGAHRIPAFSLAAIVGRPRGNHDA